MSRICLQYFLSSLASGGVVCFVYVDYKTLLHSHSGTIHTHFTKSCLQTFFSTGVLISILHLPQPNHNITLTSTVRFDMTVRRDPVHFSHPQKNPQPYLIGMLDLDEQLLLTATKHIKSRKIMTTTITTTLTTTLTTTKTTTSLTKSSSGGGL